MKEAKTEFAYNKIKEKIILCKLKPFEDISEDVLQEELNISRTPIREAIKKLEQEKFVYIYPRKGTIVSGITFELINEIYEIRESIEPFVAKMTVNKLSGDWLLKMKQGFMEEPHVTSLEERKEYYTNLDREFHRHIIFSHNNTFIHNIMENIFDHDHRIRMNVSTVNEEWNLLIAEHLNIIEVLLARDAKQVEDKMRAHIVTSRKKVIERLFGIGKALVEN